MRSGGHGAARLEYSLKCRVGRAFAHPTVPFERAEAAPCVIPALRQHQLAANIFWGARSRNSDQHAAGVGDQALRPDKIADVVLAMRKCRELLLTGGRAGKFDTLPSGEDGIPGRVPADWQPPVSFVEAAQAQGHHVFGAVDNDAALAGDVGRLRRAAHCHPTASPRPIGPERKLDVLVVRKEDAGWQPDFEIQQRVRRKQSTGSIMMTSTLLWTEAKPRSPGQESADGATRCGGERRRQAA